MQSYVYRSTSLAINTTLKLVYVKHKLYYENKIQEFYDFSPKSYSTRFKIK